MKYIPRLLVAPFIFTVLFIAQFVDIVRKSCIGTYYFIANGGEVLPYTKKDRKTIAAIYDMLSEELENKNRGN